METTEQKGKTTPLQDLQNEDPQAIMELQRQRIAELEKNARKSAREINRLQQAVEQEKIYANAKANQVAARTLAQRERDRFLMLLLSNSPNVILFFDKTKRVAFFSDSFLKSFDISDVLQVSGNQAEDVFRLFCPEEIIRILSEALNEAMMFNKSLSRSGELDSGGTKHNFLFYLTPMTNPDGENEGAMLLLNDVTELEHAREEAEHATMAKSQFLSNMSHEFRTSLNAIIGLTDILLEQNLKDSVQLELEKIYASAMNLLDLVNDILDISKIEAGGFQFVPMEYKILDVLNDAIQFNIVRIGSKRIVFRLEADNSLPSVFWGDEIRIVQVLNNLLSNAFKYTQEGFVTLSVSWEKISEEKNPEGKNPENALLIFAVSDTGIGIKKRDLGKLFTEYGQLDARANRKIEGTGLGLSITKNLVSLMGGTIQVESEYGKGSLFTATLKQKIVDETPIDANTLEKLKHLQYVGNRRTESRQFMRSRLRKGHVLVVDDISTNLDVMRGLLQPYDLQVDCVSSGREAIEAIRREAPRYDLVFMDHMMPEMDGLETTRIIRMESNSEYAKNVPVIMLTANALKGNREKFLGFGFNGYISKPIDIVQLDACLAQWIGVTPQYGEMPVRRETKEPGLPRDVRVEGVDLEAGVHRFGSEKIYLDVLRTYVEEMPRLLERLRNADSTRLADYGLTVHGLKGSSAGICANALALTAENLEYAAKNGDLTAVLKGNGKLLADADALIEKLKILLSRTSADKNAKGEGKPRAPKPDRALLEEMKKAAENFHTSELIQLMKKLENYEYDSEGDRIARLREAMTGLEYENIINHLTTWLKETE
ncbi:MAG: response regulator [Synergistaceae bacterium]|jgi:signal transduction histidine kinase/ActR/RegA family two-component response regulator/HPt (histidine-containing phosphotransfer) domain-containing protein|nr:response regulator [Synergistaceae bacterium]